MSSTTAPRGRTPLWRDVRVLRVGFQIAVVGLVLFVVLVLVGNVRANSERLGIPTGFEYLDDPAQFPIPDSDFRQTQPVRDAVLQGLGNTLRVSIAGMVLATVLGTLVGVGRLSRNFVIRSLARIFVETLRNIPLLLLIIFAYTGLALAVFPRIEEAWRPLGLGIVSNRGVYVPWYTEVGVLPVLATLAAVIAALWAVARWRRSVNEATGAPLRTVVWSIPAVVLVAALGWVISGAVGTVPDLDGRVATGGIRMSPEYFAILFALVVYTASHIAEIVRGSIQAIARGQAEAAEALALSGPQRLRFVILPQAFRIAVPPLGNQYLNLLKNSTLGAVVSYYELAQVTAISIGNSAPPVPSWLLALSIFLGLSLVVSALVNLANRRLALVER